MVKGTTEDEDKIRQLLSNLQYRNSIRQLLLTRKTIARLEEIAKGEEEKEK